MPKGQFLYFYHGLGSAQLLTIQGLVAVPNREDLKKNIVTRFKTEWVKA